jgi:pilus assembly protein Flp/PilA
MYLSLLNQMRDYAARHGERGQGLVEYALILILVSVVVIVVLTSIGETVNNTFLCQIVDIFVNRTCD